MSHLLERLELEIHTGDEALGRELLDRLSRLRQGAITPLLERVLNQLSPPGCRHRIETLELDLGAFSVEELERQLPLALERALWRALPPLLQGAVVPEAIEQSPRPPADPGDGQGLASGPADAAAKRELLPSASSARSAEPDPSRASPSAPVAPVEEAGAIRATLAAVLALPAATAAALLEQLAPAASDRERLLAAADPGQRPQLRRLLLQPGISQRASSQGPNSPSPSSQGASSQAGISQRPGRPDSESNSRSPELAPPDPELAPQPEAANEVPATAPDTASATASRDLELLAWFASRGTLPWWAPRHDQGLVVAAIEVALALPRAERTALLRQLAAAGAGPPKARQVAAAAWLDVANPRSESAPPAPSLGLERLLRAASDAQRPWLRQALAEALEPGALGDGLPRVAEEAPEAAPSALRSPLARSRQPEMGAAAVIPAGRQLSATPGEHQNQHQSQSQSQSHTQGQGQGQGQGNDAALSGQWAREEGLTVEGAGVVLLWPFLETLMRRLELLDEESWFRGAAERQRALALLGFLVDRDPRPPEWRLSLAKLLGGLPLEELGALEQPLGEAEQCEAEALLQAVLVHGKGLLGDDLETLRARWLQRPGWLEPRPGCWLLLVERREGDELLEALPWSWDWIRLPWMDKLLRVAW